MDQNIRDRVMELLAGIVDDFDIAEVSPVLYQQAVELLEDMQ